jgi:DNA topoisomerase-6 subunit B
LKPISATEYLIIVEDNGPGLTIKTVPNVFGRLLYGSRFHSIRQSRGQQGIGISAAVMYGQLTTGKPAKIKSKTEEKDVAYEIELIIDTKKNRPEITTRNFVMWEGKVHGTRIEIAVKGKYVRGKQSVLEYLKGTAIVNPHAKIRFVEPDGSEIMFDRVTEQIPMPTKEIKPHPEGLELGTLLKMAKVTKAKKVTSFLTNEFSRISYRVAREICEKAEIDEKMNPKQISLENAKKIITAIKKIKIMAPQTDCLSPIGDKLIKKGLKNVLGDTQPEFYSPPVTRDPMVYSGNPFQVEVGIVYGGASSDNGSVRIIRFANRVPLLYQQGGCVCTKAVEGVDWRRYGLEQKGGSGIPYGSAVIFIHVASTKIPFTSEAKEAIANIPEIKAEIEKALRICARKLQIHLNKQVKKSKTRAKFDIIQKILPKIAEKSSTIVSKPIPDLDPVITKIMDVVWIDDTVEYKNKEHLVSIKIHNYTPTRKKFNLYAVIPPNSIVEKSINIKPSKIRKSGKIRWELKSIPSTEKFEINFKLRGLDKDEYDESDLYVSGISSAQVIGAESLPGDWNLDEETDVPLATIDDFIDKDILQGGPDSEAETVDVETQETLEEELNELDE